MEDTPRPCFTHWCFLWKTFDVRNPEIQRRVNNKRKWRKKNVWKYEMMKWNWRAMFVIRLWAKWLENVWCVLLVYGLNVAWVCNKVDGKLKYYLSQRHILMKSMKFMGKFYAITLFVFPHLPFSGASIMFRTLFFTPTALPKQGYWSMFCC